MNKKIIILLVIISSFGCYCKKSNDIESSIKESHQKSIPGIYYSEIVLDDFYIYLNLPSGYNDTASQGYHVVYLLDGDWYFNSFVERTSDGGTVAIFSKLNSKELIPKVITVGIGYPEENLRERDFLYPHNPRNPKSGGAENFYNFLKDELIPRIDSLFNTQKDKGRTLIGHSYGGYFTMYSLFHYRSNEQLLSNNYLAISPSNSYSTKYLNDLDELMAIDNNKLPVNLYMSVGDLEWANMQIGFDTIVNRFNTRNYDGFNFKPKRYVNKDHGTVVIPSIEDGMIWFFNQ